MNEHDKTRPKSADALPVWKAGAYVVFILIKLVLILAMLNKDTVEFIYAGF